MNDITEIELLKRKILALSAEISQLILRNNNQAESILEYQKQKTELPELVATIVKETVRQLNK